jgi:iron complex transport system permease protein
MQAELKRRYVRAGLALVAVAALSVFIRLDFSNAALLIKEFRIPRLILAIAVGGSLSLSGLVMQTVLGNPLADPYTLGIASGAALGAAIGSSLGMKAQFFGLNLSAVIGAGAVIAILFRVIRRSVFENESMILLGVMLSLTASSLLAIWMALADPVGVQSINFWLLGDLSRVGYGPALALLGLAFVMGLYFWYFSRNLDAFLFGDDWVEGFGVSRDRTRKIAVVLVSILVGFCVSAVGMIGFVGLVVPHMLRRALRTSIHRQLIPLSMIWGAVVLILSDVIAKGVGDPRELPVGAVTAVVGAPVFVRLFMLRSRGGVE